MLTVSLHGIKLHAPHGLYPQEHILGNNFEVDVDVHIPVPGSEQWPFVDYTVINGIVNNVFQQPGQLLETFVHNIYTALRNTTPNGSKIRVAVRKMNPPMQGDVSYSQVTYEA